jgi:hypothetical protein
VRILLISASPINKETNIGNTFLNIIPEEIELFSIYTKNGFPDERIKKAFFMNEKMIIDRIIGKRKCVGKLETNRYNKNNLTRDKKSIDEKVIQIARKKRYIMMFWIQGFIWRLNVWKSKELKEFISEINPDLIFTVFSNNIFLNRIILHILKISQKPFVLYAWDNNYQWNKYQKSPLKWLNQYFERIYMRKIMQLAKKIYVISNIQRQDYKRIFRKECSILTKGVDFSENIPIKKEYNTPLQFVYTGNLGNNRWKSLAMIADALEIINKEGIKGQLKIYTTTPLKKEMKLALNRKQNSVIMGSVPANEIYEIQKKADVLIHVESFDYENSFLVRHSFSTKIVDYLKMARLIFVVGPRSVASIDYFIKNNAGLVANNEKEILENLEKIILNKSLLKEYGMKAFFSGKKNHSKKRIEDMLKKDFYEIK